MKFIPLQLQGAWVLEPDRREDQRGFFARTFCREEFSAQGMNPDIAQVSISFNERPYTLRGMHYQAEPFGEEKLVRCTMGAIFDVILDLRESSPTFRQWQAIELSAQNHNAVYIPKGFAHGFLTMQASTEVLYQISTPHRPEAATGVRWDDPAFGISWPVAPAIISDRDRSYPVFDHRTE